MRTLSAPLIFLPEGFRSGIFVIVSDTGKILSITDSRPVDGPIEEFNGILVPGFINTHCHLELSHLKGLIPRNTGLIGFVNNLMKVRGTISDEDRMIRIQEGETEMVNNGIVAVGDISNELVSLPVKSKSRLRFHTFVELLALNPTAAESIFIQGKATLSQYPLNEKDRHGLAPHAPYTVSEGLFRFILAHEAEASGISTLHLGESLEENEFFSTGEGPIQDLYKRLNIDLAFWQPTAESSIRSIIPYLHPAVKMLLVHNTQLTESEIQWANSQHANLHWCLCPKANLYITGNLPPVPEFIEQGCKITLGTDSLASNDSLDILDEMSTLQTHFPAIKLATMLSWATQNGAEALNFDDTLGSIEVGKQPGILELQHLSHNTLHLTPKTRVNRII